MNATNPPILIAVLRQPQSIVRLNLSEWDLLIRQARSAGLLARLGILLTREGMISQVPSQALKHLQSAIIYTEQFDFSVSWEIQCILKALAKTHISPIFLKGCAYFLAGNDAAKARVFSDVDILVSKSQLADVERALMSGGWIPGAQNTYDQKYYRQWMHELPPMQHYQRNTSIDVHHNILPKTCKMCPDANELLNNKVKLHDRDIWVLSPEDRILHSAAHLFYEGELEHGLRDLSDLDLLFREFSSREHFWETLFHRAEKLKQQRPLFYSLRYTTKILHTPVPESVLNATMTGAPTWLTVQLMDMLYFRALLPNHPSCNDLLSGLSRWMLFIRSHWLRMPMRLLIPHLARKAYKRLKPQYSEVG